MQIERLLYVIDEILDDYEAEGQIKSLLTALVNSLSNLSSQPAEPAHGESFQTAIYELRDALENSCAATFAPSLEKIVATIGGTKLVGLGLLQEVESVINQHPFIAATAQQRITEIQTDVANFGAKLSATKESLEQLSFQPLSLNEREFDLGLVLPDSVTQGSLEVLVEELGRWNEHLKHILEAATGKSESLKIRSACTGSFEISFAIDPQGAIAVLMLIGGIKKIFGKRQEAKDAKDVAEKNGFPEDVIEKMEAHIEEIEVQELTTIRKTVMDKSPVDETRKGEIDKGIREALKYITDKMKEGVDIEVLAGPSDNDEESDGELPALPIDASDLRPDIRHSLQAALEVERKDHGDGKSLPSSEDNESEDESEEMTEEEDAAS